MYTIREFVVIHRDDIQAQRSIHDNGSLTVFIPLSITLVIIYPFRGGRLKPAIHTTYTISRINAALRTNAYSSLISYPRHHQTPYADIQPLKKRGFEKGRRPGAEANVYNTTAKRFLFTVPEKLK
jgi:hypothetical protein